MIIESEIRAATFCIFVQEKYNIYDYMKFSRMKKYRTAKSLYYTYYAHYVEDEIMLPFEKKYILFYYFN